jgi:hypothetical protein
MNIQKPSARKKTLWGQHYYQIMAEIIVSNSLVRLNGDLMMPPPFERPREDLNLWVLELSGLEEEKFESWWSRAALIIKFHERTLKAATKDGATLTLFLESRGKGGEVLRLEPQFANMLVNLNMAFEHFHRLL